MRGLLLRGSGCAVVALVATACTFDQKTVGVPQAQVVVHSVLDVGRCEQQVLVERTLTGTITVPENARFSALDPVRSGGGVPVSGAQVTITAESGKILVGREEGKTPGGPGAGLYTVREPDCVAPVIQAGGRYALQVVAPEGTVVSGTTVVPATVVPAMEHPLPLSMRFDRDSDTLRLDWRAATGARAYGLWVESPFAPFLMFSDSTTFSLAGDMRNVFSARFRRLFIPGFSQQLALFAADTNYFDYYRSRNDPFTGSGLINHLRGGIGLFGSIMVIQQRVIDVTQKPREPAIEGVYELVEAPRLVATVLRLYVETPGEPAALSGWYASSGATDRAGIDGTRSEGRIRLHLLANQYAADTVAAFTGTQVGDSLVGSYTGLPGRVVFRKRRAQ
jgi:hypothetical protein